jgi:hypothetical protein
MLLLSLGGLLTRYVYRAERDRSTIAIPLGPPSPGKNTENTIDLEFGDHFACCTFSAYGVTIC